MREHVLDLLQRHEIVFTWCRRPTEAWGARDLWEVSIAAIKSEISYATALHEIGHILGKHQASQNSLVRERWAWHWAQANALAWTARMEADRVRSLDLARTNQHRKTLTQFVVESGA
jgi:hypothetical protein